MIQYMSKRIEYGKEIIVLFFIRATFVMNTAKRTIEKKHNSPYKEGIIILR